MRFLLLYLGAFGCGGEPAGVVVLHPDAPPIAPATECVVRISHEPATERDHRDPCSEIAYPSHPPAGGPHYGSWADFGTYTAPVPSGFLVHSLEHGAVELLHGCSPDCPEVLDAFGQIATAQADDVLCRDHPAGSRVIIAPDPTLDVAFAAVAWEHVYRATCLDEASLTAFVDEHYAQAPEDLCFAGVATPACP